MKPATKLLLPALIGVTLSGCFSDGEDGNNGLNGSHGTDGKNGAGQVISLERIGRTASRGFLVSAAEIVDFDKHNKRIFTVNANSGEVDIFTAEDVSDPRLFSSLNMAQMLLDNGKVANTALVGAANSISINNTLAAIAVEANPKTDNGWLVFINTADLSYVNAVPVGAQPDMVTFSPDGKMALTANEGEPDAGYTVDPEGSISIIDTISFAVSNISFAAFNTGGSRNSELPLEKMVIDGYQASVAQSIEPEYIAVSADSSKAYVTLQENNAIAVIDIAGNSIDKIIGLGFKDFSIPGNELDAGDSDDGINIKNWPVMGIYMPDSISSISYNGKTYLLTANEGDSREDFLSPITDQSGCENSGYYFYSGECLDEVRVKHLVSRAGLTISSQLDSIDDDANLGRLKASFFSTRANNGSTIKKVYAYGGRSFSIWDSESGLQVFDSANQFEWLTALRYGNDFNNNHEENASDSRSDDKGPEPEAITTGKINGHTYAFIGLERMGGIIVYDISNPYAPLYVQYVNDRNLTVAPAADADAGDLGPEGLRFVSAIDSPNGKPLLMVGNEVSGTTAIYQVNINELNAGN